MHLIWNSFQSLAPNLEFELQALERSQSAVEDILLSRSSAAGGENAKAAPSFNPLIAAAPNPLLDTSVFLRSSFDRTANIGPWRGTLGTGAAASRRTGAAAAAGGGGGGSINSNRRGVFNTEQKQRQPKGGELHVAPDGVITFMRTDEDDVDVRASVNRGIRQMMASTKTSGGARGATNRVNFIETSANTTTSTSTRTNLDSLLRAPSRWATQETALMSSLSYAALQSQHVSATNTLGPQSSVYGNASTSTSPAPPIIQRDQTGREVLLYGGRDAPKGAVLCKIVGEDPDQPPVGNPALMGDSSSLALLSLLGVQLQTRGADEQTDEGQRDLAARRRQRQALRCLPTLMATPDLEEDLRVYHKQFHRYLFMTPYSCLLLHCANRCCYNAL